MNKVEQIKKLKSQLDHSRVRNRFYRDKMEGADKAAQLTKDITDALLYEVAMSLGGEFTVNAPKIGNSVEFSQEGGIWHVKAKTNAKSSQREDV